MKIEINNGGFRVDSNFIESAVKETFQRLQELKKIITGQNVEISIAVISREEIQEVNKKWRDKDEETDVLSFCYENTTEKLEGEVVLCLDVIKENAKQDGIKEEEELRKNVIHSILHIIGYEHGDEMFKLQAEINNRLLAKPCS